MTEQTLHFSIEGAFITKFARELLYERHDLDKAISYLKDCTLSDELSETEHIKLIRTSSGEKPTLSALIPAKTTASNATMTYRKKN